MSHHNKRLHATNDRYTMDSGASNANESGEFEYFYSHEEDDGMAIDSAVSQNGSLRKRKRHTVELTVPVSPVFATSMRGPRKYIKSSEELELERIQQKAELMQMEKAAAEQRRMKALFGGGYMPTRSVAPLTQPEEFQFATDSRAAIRKPIQDPETTPPEAKKRKNAITLPEGGITVPQPFHFNVDNRLQRKNATTHGRQFDSTGDDAMDQDPPRSPWMSLAAKIKKIERETPDRFKLYPRKAKTPPREFSLTIPEEFQFHTSTRRPIEATVERPVEQFKARPLNKKILESCGDIGLPRVQKREVTIPQSPHFSVDERAAMKPELEPIRDAKRREVMMKRQIKEQVISGIPAFQLYSESHFDPHNLTVPQSPMLMTKGRSQMKPAPVVATEEPKPFKARPMPVIDRPFAPALNDIRITEPMPFNLESDQRHYESEMRRNKQLEEERRRAEEAKQFKARPVPVVEPFRPTLELKITEPQPFQLKSEELHDIAVAIHQQKIAKEEDQRRKKAEFHALPIKSCKPFEPKRSSKPLTEIDPNFQLSSESRAEQRKVFEGRKLAKEMAAAEAERRKKQVEEEMKQQEINNLRQKLVHKALPVPSSTYRAGFIARPSQQALTEPETPKLKVNKRAVQRRGLVGRDL